MIYKATDSGAHHEFDTGTHEGKGRCDLLPACSLLRLSKQYELGALKYTERDWEKGVPMNAMLDNALRHLLQYLDGDNKEDNLAAAAWYILGMMWNEEHMPEMQNIPSRIIAPIQVREVYSNIANTQSMAQPIENIEELHSFWNDKKISLPKPVKMGDDLVYSNVSGLEAHALISSLVEDRPLDIHRIHSDDLLSIQYFIEDDFMSFAQFVIKDKNTRRGTLTVEIKNITERKDFSK